MKKTLLLILCTLALAAGGVLALRFALPASAPAPTPTTLPAASPAPSLAPETPAPTETPEAAYYTLSFVGDCTLGSSPKFPSAYSFQNVVGDNYAWPFAATRQYLEDDYLTIANMEGVFTTATEAKEALFTFKADPVYARVFSSGSVELVSLGNNHAGDYLEPGRADTRAALEAEGVLYADENDICLYQQGDGPLVGVYAKLYPTAWQVTEGVRRLREAGAELIVVAAHWGLEGSYRPTLDQLTAGRAAIDAGADIVYGAHPHVLQPVEGYAGGLILYSLGNWSFGGNTAPQDRDTAIVQVRFRRDPDGTLTLDACSAVPCSLSGSAGYNDYQPTPYEPDAPGYARVMRKLNGSFDGEDLTVDYSTLR